MKLKRGKIGWDDFVIGLDLPIKQTVPFPPLFCKTREIPP